MSKHIKKKKRAPQKSRVKKSPLKLINLFIIILSVILLGVITNMFINDKENSSNKDIPIPHIIEQTIEKEKSLEVLAHEKFEEKTKALEIEYIDVNAEHITKKDTLDDRYHFRYEEQNTTITTPKQEIHVLPPTQIEKKDEIKASSDAKQTIKKPKLIIIIDDVSSARQVNAIQNIGFPVTMAFLPPTTGHKNSAKIAQDLAVYMVHLPLEASNRSFEEENTLHIGDSLQKIENKIKKIKQYYPNTRYLNNHTGSKFTSDFDSMDKLFTVLKKYNYIFVDSKTTAKSVTKHVAKKHNMPYISRNIFLDNKHEKIYIQNQLKKAINIAKQTGLAIAIGHPHKETLKTLKASKSLLDEVELIQINQIEL